MSNSKVLGQSQIDAIFDFPNSQITIAAVTIKSDVRASNLVSLAVQHDVKTQTDSATVLSRKLNRFYSA